ncbi:TPA: hypothetical protein ACKUPG_004430 [Bacillus cereus]
MGATESGDDLVVGEENVAQHGTRLVGNVDRFGNYGNDFVLEVEVPTQIFRPRRPPNGIRTWGGKNGVISSGIDVGVFGAGGSLGVVGKGINGVVGDATAVDAEIGVVGDATREDGRAGGVGVWGSGFNGVRGDGTGQGRNTGVIGTGAVGMWGDSPGSADGSRPIGVLGTSNTGGAGVMGISRDRAGIGVWGVGSRFGVFCRGRFAATGTKSALVPHPDGFHRTLYCMESPESWFEDFGTGELVEGIAEVQIDPEFKEIIHNENYHVFITPEGDSKGLYVSKKTSKSFEVREQQEGRSNISFSYRVVAKRKDVTAPRLEKVEISDEEVQVDIPEKPKHPQKHKIDIRDLE